MTMDEKEKAMAMSRGGGPMCSVLEWDAAGDRLVRGRLQGQRGASLAGSGLLGALSRLPS